MLHRYTTFGLEIESDIALPELVQGRGGEPDLVIARGAFSGLLATSEHPVLFRFREDEPDEGGGPQDIMSWADVGHFRLLGKNRLEIVYANGASPALISLPLLGPVMAMILHRQGLLTLHGSAIALEGRASVFLGDKGAGKSTTAAALVRAGHGLVTDDIVAVDVATGRPTIWPGYPQVKLTDTATEALPLDQAEIMVSPHPDFGKNRHLLTGTFDTAAVPMGEAVVLQRGDHLSLDVLEGLEAVKALMRFSYVTRFGDRVLKGMAQATHLRQCAEIARTVPVYRLTVPHDLTRLDAVAQAIRIARASGADRSQHRP